MSGESLGGILVTNGLTETTTLEHKRKAIRVFKVGNSSTKRVELDFSYVKVYNRVLADQKIVLTPEHAV